MSNGFIFRTQETSGITYPFLLAKLSRVNSLFLDRRHRRNCTLGGISNFQTELTNTGVIPLKLQQHTKIELSIFLMNYKPKLSVHPL
jgi:hypothetical protein